MGATSLPSQEKTSAASPRFSHAFYLATWRWHFYAGFFVIPFLLMLSLTGLLMLYHDPIEAYQYGDRLFVTPPQEGTAFTAASEQAAAVTSAFPDAPISQYIPPSNAERSSQFTVEVEGQNPLTIFVNPYDNQILGTLDYSTSVYSWANGVHGTFFLGEFGDRLIEIAAGLSIMLVVSGLYLWWPRDRKGLYRAFVPRLRGGKRDHMAESTLCGRNVYFARYPLFHDLRHVMDRFLGRTIRPGLEHLPCRER